MILRYLSAIAIALAVMAGWTYTHDQKVARRVVHEINSKTKVLNEKARRARNRTLKPGSVARLRKKYCRDC